MHTQQYPFCYVVTLLMHISLEVGHSWGHYSWTHIPFQLDQCSNPFAPLPQFPRKLQ